MNSEANRQRIIELFEAALLKLPPHRVEYLRNACGDDELLLAEVSSLVTAYERLGDTSQPTLVRSEGTPPSLQRIGRYEIGRELGRGGMGIVFEARDPVIGRTVALKTILLEGYRMPAERARLQEHLFREARSAGVLSHPNIVTIHDSGLEEELAFVAMEQLDGPTLLHRLSTGVQMDRDEVLGILRQAAAALDYAHQAGVVHRDIKPSNIMFHHGTTIKITDFGIAKIASTEPTRTGMHVGTPNYMSPEQIQGYAVDGRSDQFSLAVVAFELLTARKPFQADSLANVVHQIVYGERPSARAAVAEFPAAVDKVFERGFAKDSRGRYETCAEFITALAASFTAAERQVESPTRTQISGFRGRRDAAVALLPTGGAPVPLYSGTVSWPSSTPRDLRRISEQASWRRWLPWRPPAVTLAVLLLACGILVVGGYLWPYLERPFIFAAGYVDGDPNQSGGLAEFSAGTIKRLVSTVPLTQSGPHRLAITPDKRALLVTNAGSNSVSIIDRAHPQNQEVRLVGLHPLEVAVSPDGSVALVSNRSSNTVSILDLRTKRVTHEVRVGLHPGPMAFSPDGALAYVVNRGEYNSLDRGTVSVIEMKSKTATSVPLGGCGPSGIAMSKSGDRAYVTNFNSDSISVILSATRTVLETMNVGEYHAFLFEGHANNDPPCSTDAYYRPIDIVLSRDGSKAYIAADRAFGVMVMSLKTNKFMDHVIRPTKNSDNPTALALSADGSLLYVASWRSKRVLIISTSSDSVVGQIPYPQPLFSLVASTE